MSAVHFRIRGFTLIELMVTLTVAAVLALVAIPSLTAYQRNAELTALSNNLFAAINAARGEAMKRGMNAMVLPANGTDWNSGWVVFVDVNRNQSFDLGTDAMVLSQSAPSSRFTVNGTGTASASAPYILYDASGFTKDKFSAPVNLSITVARNDLTGASLFEQTRLLLIANTGRVRICKPSSANDTNCKSSLTD